MGSPVLWGPNNYATNLQNAEITGTGALLQYNGPKNYITYGNFENQLTTGWSLGTVGTLTNGLPTGSPTFGSGAAGTLSTTITTSANLTGLASLQLVSSAATTQGNMLASQAYSIDVADQAKVLQVTFYYAATVGAANSNFSGSSSNSWAWAVWDVTNSVWLTSAGNFNLVQNSGTGFCSGTIQTGATTASIRFVLYAANVTTGAVTLTLDNFLIGPQTSPLAPAMSDWQSYSMVITGSTSNPSLGTNTQKSYWRRVGDSVEILYQLSQTTNGTAGSGTYLFSLPPGLSIDTSKITTTTANSGLNGSVVGNSYFGTTTAGNTQIASPGAVIIYDSTHLALAQAGTTAVVSSYVYGTGWGQSLGTNPVYIGFHAIVPVVGWSSNSVASSDTDTRVVAMQAYLSTNTANAGANTVTPFNTVLSDTHGGYSTSTNLYTIPVSGYYRVSVSGITTSASGTFYIRKNSTSFQDLASVVSGVVSSGAQTILCNAGDTLGVFANASLTFAGSGAPYQFCLSIERLSGPAVITATESVNASYTTAAGQALSSGSLGLITYGTRIFDSHSAYSSGIYTVPISGKMRVSAAFATSAFNTSTTLNIAIYKNGSSLYKAVIPTIISVSNNWSVQISNTVSVNAGDTISIYGGVISQAGVTLQADATQCFFSIERVGN